MKIFDISNPENISVDETIDIVDILEDELDDWGDERSSSSYYGRYPLSEHPTYVGYGGLGYSGWGGHTYGGYGGYSPGGYSGWGGPTYGGYDSYSSGGGYYTPPSPWDTQYLSTGFGSYVPINPWGSGGPGYSGWGGPTYGGYNPGGGYSGWVRGRYPAY